MSGTSSSIPPTLQLKGSCDIKAQADVASGPISGGFAYEGFFDHAGGIGDLKLEDVAAGIDVEAYGKGIGELLRPLAREYVVVFGKDGHVFGEAEADGGACTQEVVVVFSGFDQVVVYDGGHELQAEAIVDLSPYEQLPGIGEAGLQINGKVGVRGFEGVDGSRGEEGYRQGDFAIRALPQEAKFGESIVMFAIGAAPHAQHEAIVHTILKTQPHACLVESKKLISPSVDVTKAVRDEKLQLPRMHGLQRMPVDDAGASESARHIILSRKDMGAKDKRQQEAEKKQRPGGRP